MLPKFINHNNVECKAQYNIKYTLVVKFVKSLLRKLFYLKIIIAKIYKPQCSMQRTI